MTIRTITAAILVALSGAALADVNNNAVSGSASNSTAGSVSGAYTGASNSANAQNVNIESPGSLRYKGGYSVRNTPDTSIFIPASTAPCTVAIGAGGSGAGFGISVGGSYEDKGCTAREDARTLAALGLLPEAIARLCQRDEMKVALGEKCGAPVATPKGSTVSYNPATKTTTVKELNGFNH